MVALLVAMSVMAIMMAVALPTWRTLAQREKEAELIFRGEQYARAIAAFQRRYGNASPPTIDVLVEQRFLRKKYLDPMTGEEFAVVTAGQPLPGDGPPGQQSTGGNPPGGRAGTQTGGRGGTQAGGTFTTTPPGGRQGRGGLQLSTTGPGAQSTGGAGIGGIVGVVSKSTEKSFRIYNGRDTYNQWVFMGVQQSNRAGGPGGTAVPGAGGGGTGQPPGIGPGRGPRGGADGRGGGGFGSGGRDGRGGPGGPRGGTQPPPGNRGSQSPTIGRF